MEDMDNPEKLEKLKEACQDYMDFVRSDESADRTEDYENPVFEAAIELFFGEDIWDEVNRLLDR